MHGVPTNVDLYIETIVICDAMNYSLTDLRLRRAAMPPQIYANVSSFDEDMTTTAAFNMYRSSPSDDGRIPLATVVVQPESKLTGDPCEDSHLQRNFRAFELQAASNKLTA